MIELLEKLKKLFRTNKSGDTYCFSLVCWTDGYWSIEVTDDWHKWSEKGINEMRSKYSTPENAIKSFMDYVKENNINIKNLQSRKTKYDKVLIKRKGLGSEGSD